MLTKMKLVCESVAFNPICSNALTVKAFTDGVARALFVDVLLIGEGAGCRCDRRQVDRIRHAELVESPDHFGVADAVTDAEAGHAVSLREGAGDENLRRRLGDIHRRLVRRVGDVVVIGLVDQNHRVG